MIYYTIDLMLIEKKYKTSNGWNEMVEMTFQPMLTYSFATNTFYLLHNKS